MEKVVEATSDLEKTLDQYGFLKKLEKSTKVPKIAMVVGAGLLLFVISYWTLGPGLLCNLVGFTYPAIASFKAIETEDKQDDTQWLTYWVVYAIFNIVETFSDIIVFWMPFYYSFKFGFLLWLFLPNVHGAQYLYKHVIHPFVSKRGIISQNKLFETKSDDEDEDIDAAEQKKDK